MFREIVRKKQALSPEDCVAILQREKRGVLAVLGDEDYPYAVPLNHYYCPEDGRIYFHSGKLGHKIDAIRRCDKVSFCVMDQGVRPEGAWHLDIRSVIVFGRIEIVEDEETVVRMARELSRKFTDDEAYIQQEIDRHLHRTLLFALAPEQITGKRVKEE